MLIDIALPREWTVQKLSIVDRTHPARVKSNVAKKVDLITYSNITSHILGIGPNNFSGNRNFGKLEMDLYLVLAARYIF